MMTADTLLRALGKESSAQVAMSSDSLVDSLLHKVSPSRTGSFCEWRGWIAAQLEMGREMKHAILLGANLMQSDLRHRWLFTFGLGWWEPGTFLASDVLAVDTDLLRAECCFAAVAGTAHSHANWLGYSSKLVIGG
jgi:hypothetical protein